MSTDGQSSWEQVVRQPMMAACLAPLVAVLLSVMTIWMAAVPALTHEVAVSLSDGCPESPRRTPLVQTVVIDFDDTVYLDGQALVSRAALDAKMRAIGAVDWSEQAEVRISPNKLATYGAVIAVMAAAQRNGVRKMGVVGLPPEFSSDWSCLAID